MSPPKSEQSSKSFPVWILVILIAIPVLVAVLGVFAALGIFGFRKYLLAAKTAEAKASIGSIAKDAASAYQSRNALCGSASKSVPASPTLIMGKKYQSSPTEWVVDGSDRGFECLKFSMGSPQYFMYSYQASGKDAAGDSFEAKANGDLNGDSVLSEFVLGGRIVKPGELRIDPSIREKQPEE